MEEIKNDFGLIDNFSIEEELEGAYGESKDSFKRDPVSGRKSVKSSKSVLNKKKLSKYEMDELFLDY